MVRSSRSIQRTLLQILFIIPALIALVFLFAVITVHDLTESQAKFARVMGQLQHTTDLITSLEAVNTAALGAGYITPDLSNRYAAIDKALEDVKRILPERDEPLFYYRTLSAMFDYSRAQTALLMSSDLPAEKVFESRSFLRNLYSFLVRHAQQLTISVMSAETELQTERIIQINRSLLRSFILILGVELTGLLLIIVLVRRIHATLHHVIDYAAGLARREWDLPDIEYYGYEDLRPVVDAFNRMKHSIVDHITDIEEKRRLEGEVNRQAIALLEQGKLLRESQLVALQSQMNPHFLFNTLNVISRTAGQNRPEETVELIQAMSGILRFNLQNLRRLVSLGEELESVEAYVLIQQHRFADNLEIRLEIPEDVPLDTVIPPMVIQPLIENAIQHGLDGKLFNRRVVCRVENLINGQIHISVEDNGSGISDEIMGALRAENTGGPADEIVHEKKEKIGLKSVIRRINLAFGERGAVEIQSEPGVFTRVSLMVPSSGEVHAV